jgi:hypothetical protein
MKVFKQFFEDNETIGDIDIYADRPGERPQPLGQVNEPGLQTISKFIYKVNKDGDKLIRDLVDDSKFNTKDYHRTFKSVLEEFDIDWGAFANHVQNRFDDGIKLHELFSGQSGEVNLKDACRPVLLPLLKNPGDYDRFFEELFSLKHSISTTSVGDGEFLLGIIGNGIKGTVGDVDVIIKDKETNQAFEIGAQKKIIGASSRVKGSKGVAFDIIETMIGYPDDEQYLWLEQQIANTYTTLNKGNVNYILRQLKVYAGQEPVHGQFTTFPPVLIVGGMVLYDYIKGHNDDYIVIVNHSSRSSNMSKEPGAAHFDCRFANIKNMTLATVVELCLKHKFFKFEMAKTATRIMF